MEILDGKYQIDQLLGEGGMGSVYRATHLGTRRTIAVKVIRPQFSDNHEFVARFQREAEAAGRLRHPNVVDVTDFGFAQTERGPVAYLVMEYLDGCSLAEIVLEEGALPTSWVIDILEQVCAAVQEAHLAGIIHRDLKPDNIWLEPDGRGGYTVKVLDFGLVKLSEQTKPESHAPTLRHHSVSTESETLLQPGDEEPATIIKPAAQTPISSQNIYTRGNQENLTRLGSVMGTPFYMSPEQCRGEVLDARSDIYSLGVIAYRLLTGATPFSGSMTQLIESHKSAEPPPIREKNRKVSRKLSRIVMSALAKDPTERPASAAGFASALRSAWEGPGHLLRRAFALYSEHFPIFFKISLLGYTPLILVLVLTNFSDRIIPIQHLTPPQIMGLGVSIILAMVAALLFAYFAVTAVTVPVVVQLTIAPLRPVSIRTALNALKRRWRIFAITSLIVMSSILVGSIVFVVPGLILALLFALYAPVVIMEPLGVRATLKRSRTLSKRALFTVLIITVLEFALPALVWSVSVTTNLTLKLDDNWEPKEFGFNVGLAGYSVFYQLLNVFVTPLLAIMISLLYMTTRKAGGESLQDASEKFEAIDLPRSKWQLRMRTRSRLSPAPSTSSESLR
jgi:serine/threonine protein kinase